MTPIDKDAVESGMIPWLKRNRQVLVNLYIFLNIAGWVAWQTFDTWTKGTMGYVELSFTIQNVIFVSLFLIRRPHTGLDKNVFHQAIAVTAFFSGLAFIGQPATAGDARLMVSNGVTFVANVLSVLTLINLGRSFGVLIAYRKVETRGLYSVVRHPMYVTDILLRVGFIISHLNWITSVLFVVSSACYVYRALLEERFLCQQEEYREYMKRVKYRFIPYIF
jgi:protein-S-isoprenylcysteine O-methyltransferase Ste14